MKTQTKRELLDLLLGLFGILMLSILLFVIWLYQPSESVSFASQAHYLRLFLQDAVFITAVRNTAFSTIDPLLFAVLAGKFLSIPLVKKEK